MNLVVSKVRKAFYIFKWVVEWKRRRKFFYNVDAWNLYINNISDLAHKTSRDARIWSIFSQFIK